MTNVTYACMHHATKLINLQVNVIFYVLFYKFVMQFVYLRRVLSNINSYLS